MIMADVFAAFGTLLVLGIALPGMLLTWKLLFSKTVERAELRLARTPWRCFFSGLTLLMISTIPIGVSFGIPGLQGFGVVAIFILLTIASIGAAGLAEVMGKQLNHLGFNGTPVSATIRGAVAMEMAAIFPIIGWFIFVPLTLIITFGAGTFALLRWAPRANSSQVVATASA